MDYFAEAYRDLLFLIRLRRRDVLMELLQASWRFAALLIILFCTVFFIFHNGDSWQFAFLVMFVLILPSVTAGVALLDYLMPVHFGRAVSGELLSIRREFAGSFWRSEATLRVRELSRDLVCTVRYAGEIEARIGRNYLVLLHPRLERHALVLFDDDPIYMETGLDQLPPGLRKHLCWRAAQFRSEPRNF